MLARLSPRAVLARVALAVPLMLAAGAALSQTHFDNGGTSIPAVVPLSGCVANGACVGPNSAVNPDYVSPLSHASSLGDGVVTGGMLTIGVNSGGGGYVTGDVGKTVNVVGGTFATAGQVTITAVSGGLVTALSIAAPGVYSAAPTGTIATTGGGATGSGLTLYPTFGPIAQTLFNGVAPVNGYHVDNPNASGDLWVTDDGVTPVGNGASAYRCAANGGRCKTEPDEKPPGSALQLLGASIGQVFIARRW
jgi:hypothetical protein